MFGGKTVQCRICGDPYKFYSHYAGDQSACPSCRAKAERNMMPQKSNEITTGGESDDVHHTKTWF